MSSAVWSLRAARQLEAYLDYLSYAATPAMAERARADIYAVADQTARRPDLSRASQRWPTYRERIVGTWHKLLVLQIMDDRMEVVALYDQRQDLSAVDPLSK